MPILPTIGRVVHYRGKFGLHAMRAAIVTCTQETLIPEGVATGQIPDLDSPTHVHLCVFTPSEEAPAFTEYNVPQATGTEINPGEWAWPVRRDT